MNAPTFNDIAMHFLATTSADRDSMIAPFRRVVGREPKTKAEIDIFIAPLIEAGMLVRVSCESAIKGCPGGKSRPATVARVSYRLTEAGREASVEFKRAHPEFLTPWQRKVLGC